MKVSIHAWKDNELTNINAYLNHEISNKFMGGISAYKGNKLLYELVTNKYRDSVEEALNDAREFKRSLRG